MKATEEFRKTIQQYLEKRGSKDPLFARIIIKPGKSMDKCIDYILETVYNSKCNGFTDDEIYSMAIHYFDEDDIITGTPKEMRVVVNHVVELTEEEKEKARIDAIEALKSEHIRNMKKGISSSSSKKNAENTIQPNLFQTE